MPKRKLSAVVAAMNIYSELDERDRTTLADWIRSQQPKVRRQPAKKKIKPSFTELVLSEKEKLVASGD